jgi:hypothetical protein
MKIAGQLHCTPSERLLNDCDDLDHQRAPVLQEKALFSKILAAAKSPA